MVERTRTRSDGSFWLDQLAPGSCRVALEPDQAARMGLLIVSDLGLPFAGGGKELLLPVELSPSN